MIFQKGNKYTDKIPELLIKMLKFDRHKRIDLPEAVEILKAIKPAEKH